MRALSDAPANEFEPVRFVLTDMDETLTWQGRLSAAAYTSLEQLQSAGIRVIPVTAAPAGWCDQMARMWPVDGVIGENGGLFFRRTADGHGIEHHYWHADDATASVAARLRTIADRVLAALPEARLADDQPFRLTSLAFARPADPVLERRIVNTLRRRYRQQSVGAGLAGWLRQADHDAPYSGSALRRRYRSGAGSYSLQRRFNQRRADVRFFQTHGRRQHRPAVSGSPPRCPPLGNARPRRRGVRGDGAGGIRPKIPLKAATYPPA